MNWVSWEAAAAGIVAFGAGMWYWPRLFAWQARRKAKKQVMYLRRRDGEG